MKLSEFSDDELMGTVVQNPSLLLFVLVYKLMHAAGAADVYIADVRGFLKEYGDNAPMLTMDDCTECSERNGHHLMVGLKPVNDDEAKLRAMPVGGRA